jgi:beta-galactosidase
VSVRNGIAFGGDYGPEQWPAATQEEDVRLMRKAGVTLVSLGIFTWSLLEPREGEYTFGWLDEVVERLHGAGIEIDLATPSAATPAWFARAYPESLPVTREGIRIGYGSRQTACPSSAAYRRATAALAERLAERYASHPAVQLWHVHNEYGAPLGECYCPASVAAFQDWLRRTYGDLESLNDAWGTLFWGQRYGEWEEIDAPRHNHSVVNPAQRLDFARFTSDEHMACFILQRDILKRANPAIPVTTNFMSINCKSMNLWKWAREVDVVSNDNYLVPEEPDNHIRLAMSADMSRSLGGGRWLLMEHSTGATNWQPRNLAKRPGELRRNSLTHVARGSDSVLFFQWRASRYGAEKFHSAMLPQGGTDTQIWRDVVALGAELPGLADVAGQPVPAEVAVVWDWESYWALELDWRPSVDVTFLDRIDAFYREFWRSHVTIDFVHPGADLSRYKLVVAPSLYMLSDTAAKNLHRYVQDGGHLLVSFFSGIVDEHDTIHSGHYPGALRDTLGLIIEEFHPLAAGVSLSLSAGGHGNIWSERVRPTTATPHAMFTDGPDAGHPAVTHNALGAGAAWYIATAPDDLRGILVSVLDAAGVVRPSDLPDTLEVVRRGDRVFLFNHGDTAVAYRTEAGETLTIPPGDVAYPTSR